MYAEGSVLRLPKLAFWYAADFGSSTLAQARALVHMLPTTDRATVLAAVGPLDADRSTQVLAADAVPAPTSDDGATGDARPGGLLTVVYNDYSWKSNST